MERFFMFDNYNSYYDWDLVLTAKDLTPPEPKTNYVDIDGMSGTLDLSESLAGEITYQDRTLTASFWTNEGSRKDRSILLRNIITVLHGKKIKIVEPDDPTHYLYGRVKIKSSENIIPYAEFSIEAICEPWRYSISEIEREITVDSQDVTNLVINNNGVKTVCPVINVTGSVNLTYGGGSASLTSGSYKISDLKFRQGANVVGVSGSGSVTFVYREAEL